MSFEEAINDNGNVVYVGIRKLPYPQLVLLGTVLTLTLKYPEVKTPLTAHTVYTTKTT